MNRLFSPQEFSQTLYESMKAINPGLERMAFYEFCYALENVYPPEGWESIEPDPTLEIEKAIGQRSFYEAVQLKPRENDRIVLDGTILRLTRMLFTGLVRGDYPQNWVDDHFYFDIRGFFFLPRTTYFTDQVIAHLGGKPFRSFFPYQEHFDLVQDISYLDFMEANKEVDEAFVDLICQTIRLRGTPLLICLAGPTAAGKTEITARLRAVISGMSLDSTTIEMDNFLIDRDLRDNKPMGREIIHFGMFTQGIKDILLGRSITIPSYDFIQGTSSHDLSGELKPGGIPHRIEPAGIIFLEGNFPFHLPDIASLVGLMIVYLTDDPVRLKRKWKRDVDYRKKYDPNYFRNRYFRTQFLRAEEIYRPLMERCDLLVDTTGAAIWLTPALARILTESR